MKSRKEQIKRVEISYWSIFCATVLVSGMGILLFGKKAILYSHVLDLNDAVVINLQAGNKVALLAYVIRERWWPVPLLFLAYTTYLGKAIGYLLTAWYGMGIGIILGAMLLHHGLTGILFILVIAFPHYLFYVVAFMMGIKINHGLKAKGRKQLLLFMVTEGVVLLGCLTEAYLNSALLKKILLLP